MNISCNIARDLLPLYHDNVCSEESRALVEEHLESCGACRAELQKYGSHEHQSENMNEAHAIQRLSKKLKKNKAASFLAGACIVALLACVGCVIAFQSIGSYIASDGTLVEPFALIPLAWFFGLLTVVFGISFMALGSKKSK